MATSIPFVKNAQVATDELKRLLRTADIVILAEDPLGHGVKLHAVHEERSFALVLYFTVKTGKSSKVVLERETEGIARAVAAALGGNTGPDARSGHSALSHGSNPLLSEVKGRPHIGIDESGKGDYFGPLVIAGVCVVDGDEEELLKMGVKDSKQISDRQVLPLAEKIRDLVTEKRHSVVRVSPEKYNELYPKIRNLNRLLAWGHARVLENLLEMNPCDLAVSDQFGDESYIKKAVMEKGKTVRLIQTPRAEEDVAVAAASILARDTFVRQLTEMSKKYGIRLPKGATSVVEIAKDFVAAHGRSELRKVAKLHFKTTERVLAESIP